MKVLVVIPARYGSTRFPGKALADLEGRPLVVRVMEQASRMDLAKWLMEEGIDSVSLNPDSVIETWLYLAEEHA